MSFHTPATNQFKEASALHEQRQPLTEGQRTILNRGHDVERYMTGRFLRTTIKPIVWAALNEILLRMPEQAFELLTEDLCISVIQPDQKVSTVYHWLPDTGSTWFVVLQSDFDTFQIKEAIGLIAHELAHVALKQKSFSGEAAAGELKADALAIEWGFADEIEAVKKITVTWGQGL